MNLERGDQLSVLSFCCRQPLRQRSKFVGVLAGEHKKNTQVG
jgi:hypothetical protein